MLDGMKSACARFNKTVKKNLVVFIHVSMLMRYYNTNLSIWHGSLEIWAYFLHTYYYMYMYGNIKIGNNQFYVWHILYY